jgi:K(+)-stimulated pyrophosphate-energized sodium pump
VVGDTVGDPFKDTSSVALNPIIKFTTLFGLLAVELAVQLTRDGQHYWRLNAAVVLFAASLVFVWRSFYSMRIETQVQPAAPASPPRVVTGGGNGSPEHAPRKKTKQR